MAQDDAFLLSAKIRQGPASSGNSQAKLLEEHLADRSWVVRSWHLQMRARD
jgi:hypothetical protein